MAWTAMNIDLSKEIFILYLSTIFWTLGYDTIYGAQDMSEDEIIGLKSTSIKFKKNIRMFVSISYLISIALIVYLFYEFFGKNIFSILIIFFIVSLFYQLLKFKKNDSKKYLRLFKLNNYSGLFLFLSICSINL